MGLVLLAFTIFVVSLVMAWRTREDGGRWRSTVVGFVRSSAWLALAFVPVLLLVLDFFTRYGVSQSTTTEIGRGLWLARQLLTMEPLYLFHEFEALWNVPLVLSLVYLGFLSRSTVRERPGALGLLAAVAGLLMIYFLNPATSRDVTIYERILPVLFLLAIVTLAACYRPELRKRYLAVAVVGAVIAVASGASRAWYHARIDPYVRDYLSLTAAIEPESTLIAFHDWRPGKLIGKDRLSWRVDPFRHLAADLAFGREIAFLGASMLSTRSYGYFPLNYRDDDDQRAVNGAIRGSARLQHARATA